MIETAEQLEGVKNLLVELEKQYNEIDHTEIDREKLRKRISWIHKSIVDYVNSRDVNPVKYSTCMIYFFSSHLYPEDEVSVIIAIPQPDDFHKDIEYWINDFPNDYIRANPILDKCVNQYTSCRFHIDKNQALGLKDG